MNVLGDLVSRTRRDERPKATALRHAPTDRTVDYRRFCTTAWKTGNFLRNEGVRTGMDVVVAPDPVPETIYAFYGAGLLGATVTFATDPTAETTKALVAPTAMLSGYEAGPRTRQVAYGEQPTDPSIAFFERDVWSENPTEPPDRFDPETTLLAGDTETSHETVLRQAAAVCAEYDIDEETTVAVRAPLTNAEAVVSGLVAPILAGGTVLVPDEETVGDVAVADGDAPESRTIRL